MIDLYDHEIRHTDENIGMLLDKLSEMGILSNTLVIITSDHGDEFLEHGSITHTAKLYDELIHVPLIFAAFLEL